MQDNYITLVERLRGKASRDNRALLDEAAAAIEELTRSRWIPADDHLPEPDVAVLVICSGKYKNITLDCAVELAYWLDEEKNWCLESFPEIQDAKISHWAPIPRLPENLPGGAVNE